MLGKLLTADGRSLVRFERGVQQLERLRTQVERVINEEARSRAALRQRKIVRLAQDLGARIAQLPHAKGKNFGWLREDVRMMLQRFEDLLMELRESLSGLDLSEKPLQDLDRFVPKQETQKQEVPQQDEEPVANPPKQEALVEPKPEVKLPELAWAERVYMETRRDVTNRVAPAGPPKDLEGAERHFPCLCTERAMMIGELNQALATLAYWDTRTPAGFTEIRWHALLRGASVKHRHAKEKIGKCRRWVEGDSMLLATRERDWKRDFQDARNALAALKGRVSELREMLEQSQATEPGAADDFERINTTRICPGMLMQELEQLGLPLAKGGSVPGFHMVRDAGSLAPEERS